MELNANGPRLIVADEVDADGAIDVELANSDRVLVYAQLSVRQAKVLAKHLLGIVGAKKTEVKVGSYVRVTNPHTSFTDRTGRVTHERKNIRLNLLVEFDNGLTCYFEASELEVL